MNKCKKEIKKNNNSICYRGFLAGTSTPRNYSDKKTALMLRLSGCLLTHTRVCAVANLTAVSGGDKRTALRS